MNKLIRIILLLFFFSLYLLLLPSCKKKEVEKGPGSGIVTPPTGANPCSASKANAENIQIFPASNPWNKDISAEPLDPNSSSIIAGIAGNSIKADFGSGLWEGAPIGIPYVVVCGNQPKTPIHFTDYGDESDPGPYPIPLTAPIEGYGSGDAHVIAVDIENKKLYELFDAHVNGNRWDAASGAIFDLSSNDLRPETRPVFFTFWSKDTFERKFQYQWLFLHQSNYTSCHEKIWPYTRRYRQQSLYHRCSG